MNYDNKSTVTIANLNGKEFFDIEIIQNSNNEFLLPIKQISEILELKISTNHQTKDIFFKDFKITKNSIFYKNKAVENNPKNIYISQGLMDNVKDEIFCSCDTLSKIFDAKISINKNDLSVIINSKNLTKKEIINKETSNKNKTYKNYTQIHRPKNKKKFFLGTINFNSSTFSDSATQIYKTCKNKSSAFNNAGSIKLQGGAYGGRWETNLMTNTYKDQLFSFSGLNFKFDKFYKNKMYEIGRISGLENEENSIGNGSIGLQIFDYNPNSVNLQDIEGEVEKNSLVKIYINDQFEKTISTYDGYYSLSNYLPNKELEKIEIKELKENGEEKTIYSKKFPIYKDKGFELEAKEKRNIFFAGISGFDDRLFAQDGYFYQNNSKKFTIGAQNKYAIKENLISNTTISYDKIIFKNSNNIWGENFYNNQSILSMGTFKNPNNLEGFTISNNLSWLKNDYLKFQTDIKGSFSKEINNNKNLFGYSAEARSIFSKNNTQLTISLYNISPNFYLSSSRYGFISDRIGGKINGNFQIKNIYINGSYNKYYSNTLKDLPGGIINFDEINFNCRSNIKNIAQLKYHLNTRNGVNNFGELSNYFQDINISKHFRNGIILEAGEQKTHFASQNLSINNFENNFKSDYSNLYLKSSFKLGNKGNLELGHNITNYNSNNRTNGYNMFKIGYTFPEIKRFLISLGLGYKYSGQNKGFNYSASLGYRTKTGMIFSLMYRYDTDMGYLFDNIYMPTSQRHSINLILNDTLAMTPSGLKSIGNNFDNSGFIEARAYLDKNQNNIYDKDDIGIENIPIKLSQHSNVYYTNKKGKVFITSTNKGIHQISINEDELPCNLNLDRTSKNNKLVLVQTNKQTTIDFKMISSIGNITGNLRVIDDFGRIKSIQDFIVVLHDKNDIEIAYSTVDKFGNYYFSGISPGEYTIFLDENFQKKYNLIPDEEQGKLSIKIPYKYKDLINIENKNLIYKSW